MTCIDVPATDSHRCQSSQRSPGVSDGERKEIRLTAQRSLPSDDELEYARPVRRRSARSHQLDLASTSLYIPAMSLAAAIEKPAAVSHDKHDDDL